MDLGPGNHRLAAKIPEAQAAARHSGSALPDEAGDERPLFCRAQNEAPTRLEQPVRSEAKLVFHTYNVNQPRFTEAQAAQACKNALEIGCLIVRKGIVDTLRKQAFPYAIFGKVITMDRREMEGYRSMLALFTEYLRHYERDRPLSITVFGPPGSGKSYGVKQLAELAVTDSRQWKKGVHFHTFNLAQFGSFAELSRLLLEVRESSLHGQLPLVFFDEFDTPYGATPIGWLRFFLAPMQDGQFQYDNRLLSLGKAVFVFAGGICSQHSEFTDAASWKTKYPNYDGDLLVAAKALDFHSRLRGSIDIQGPNPRMNEAEDRCHWFTEAFQKSDFAFVIRRAIIIRSLIEQTSASSQPGILDANHELSCDQDVLNALLLANQYKHGARSIEAILEMSTLAGARKLTKTNLPSPAQLRLHCDNSLNSIARRDYSSTSLANEISSRVLKELHAKP